MQLPPEQTRLFWDASLRKAEAAELAALAIEPGRKRSAYSLGLISDVGLPLLMAMDPDFYADRLPFRPMDRTWTQAEASHFGVDHAEAGAYLLERWDVDEVTCRRVRTHHQLPENEDDAGLTLALFVAGLLPHDDGEIDPADLDRLIAVHGRVLQHAYATPDAYLGHVYLQAQQRVGREPKHAENQQLEIQPFLAAMASNTLNLIGEMHQLQHNHAKKKEHLNNLRFEAFTDPLTKVLNRRGFFSLAEQRLAKLTAQAGPGVSGCCLMLDLNEFKPVNDRYGHDVGDLMLRGLAKLLRRAIDRHQLIGRLGGDEFAIFLTDLSESAARAAADRIVDTCQGKMIRVNPKLTLPLSFSLGAVFCDRLGDTGGLDPLLTAADGLMYRHKRTKQTGIIFERFDPAAAAKDAAEQPSDTPLRLRD
jgi:diguanylate cyclase (GGDEF)-like protein